MNRNINKFILISIIVSVFIGVTGYSIMTTKKQVKIMLLVKAQIQQVIIKQKQITRSLQVAILEA